MADSNTLHRRATSFPNPASSSGVPLVSVMIPTRERPDTLRHALRTVVEQSYRKLEIIVSDNAGGPATREVVEGFADPRIRYVNTGRRVSMSENFEFALSHVTGDWVTAIGDDDGILPTGIERALWALTTTGLKALGSRPAHFRWPLGDGSEPEMYLTVPMGRGFRVVEAKWQMRQVLHERESFVALPLLYTCGMLARSLIEHVKAKSGRFYRSQTPDVYSGMAACMLVDRYVYMDEPVFVAGASRHSNGANIFGAPGAAYAAERNIPLHEALCVHHDDFVLPMLPLIVYEAYLQASFLQHTNAETSYKAQLFHAMRFADALSSRQPGYVAVAERWGRRFGERHGVNWDEIGVLRAQSRAHPWDWTRFHADRLLRHYRVDRSQGLPYGNVNDAACIAEQVFRSRPSMIANYARSLRRKLGGGSA